MDSENQHIVTGLRTTFHGSENEQRSNYRMQVDRVVVLTIKIEVDENLAG
jgi:hypothetical protein